MKTEKMGYCGRTRYISRLEPADEIYERCVTLYCIDVTRLGTMAAPKMLRDGLGILGGTSALMLSREIPQVKAN
jgi:hypothetical protein